jgi:hypothetical protein
MRSGGNFAARGGFAFEMRKEQLWSCGRCLGFKQMATFKKSFTLGKDGS